MPKRIFRENLWNRFLQKFIEDINFVKTDINNGHYMLWCVRYFCPCVGFSGSLVKRLPTRQLVHFRNKMNTSCNIRFPKSLAFIQLMKETNRHTVQRHWYRQTDSAIQL